MQQWEKTVHMSSVLPPDWNEGAGSGEKESDLVIRQLKMTHNGDIRIVSLAVQQQSVHDKSYTYPKSHTRAGVTLCVSMTVIFC